MNQLETEDPLIAPSEVRELLARLTDQTVEAFGPQEPRTLAGLALQTGVPVEKLRTTLGELRHPHRPFKLLGVVPAIGVGIVLIAAILVRFREPLVAPYAVPAQTAPAHASFPAAKTDPANLGGLVALSLVTFGPDSGNLMADTTFHPSEALPDGLSISATVEPVLWGVGDARKAVIDSTLDPKQVQTLKTDLSELLQKVREDAAKRDLTHGNGAGNSASVSFSGPSFSVDVEIRAYGADTNMTVALPVPDAKYDDAAKDIIRNASNSAAAEFQSMLKWHEQLRRQDGP